MAKQSVPLNNNRKRVPRANKSAAESSVMSRLRTALSERLAVPAMTAANMSDAAVLKVVRGSIASELAEGRSLAAIAKTLGVGVDDVRKLAEESVDEATTTKDARPSATAAPEKKKPGRPKKTDGDKGTSTRDAELIAAYNDGSGVHELAEAFNLSTARVRGILKKNGVALRPRTERVADTAPAKGKPGRPKKTTDAVPTKRKPGRPKKADAPSAAPEPVPVDGGLRVRIATVKKADGPVDEITADLVRHYAHEIAQTLLGSLYNGLVEELAAGIPAVIENAKRAALSTATK